MIRKKEGFTLVELLVVIAIIIILAAILFPVFARARDKAQQSKCINNLKQMGAAIALYEDDYDNIMPWFVSPAEAYGYSWKDLMEPYVKQMKAKLPSGQAAPAGYYAEQEGELYQCPSAPIQEWGTTIQSGRSMGYNPYLRYTISTTAVRYPATTLRLTETCFYDPENPPANPSGGSWSAPHPDNIGSPLWAPGWHSGMNDVLWVDGHVSAIPWQRVMLRDNVVDDRGKRGNVWCRLAPKPAYSPEG